MQLFQGVPPPRPACWLQPTLSSYAGRAPLSPHWVPLSELVLWTPSSLVSLSYKQATWTAWARRGVEGSKNVGHRLVEQL